MAEVGCLVVPATAPDLPSQATSLDVMRYGHAMSTPMFEWITGIGIDYSEVVCLAKCEQTLIKKRRDRTVDVKLK